MKIVIKRNRRDGFIQLALAGLGAVTGLAGGILGSKENKKAQKSQQQLQRETNEQNIELWREGRGSKGAAVLPLYFAEGYTPERLEFMPPEALPFLAMQYGINPENLTGDALKQAIVRESNIPFEQRAAEALTSNFLMGGTPAQQAQALQSSMGILAPAQDAATRTIASIFDGSLTAEEMANLQPVLNARTNAAEASVQANDKALQDTLNAISAGRQESGFGGDSFAKRMITHNARVNAAQNNASVRSLAKYQNRLDELTQKRTGVSRRLASLNAPTQGVLNQAAFNTAPQTAIAQNMQSTLSPMDFFRITPSSTSVQTPNAVRGTMGSTVLGGLSSLASGIGSYAAAGEALNVERAKANMDPVNIWSR